jgi:hypothetical protein
VERYTLLTTAFWVCLFFFGLLPANGWSLAETSGSFKNLTLYWENDVFGNTDRDYTNGLKITLSRPFDLENENSGDLDHWTYPLFTHLPFLSNPHAEHALSYSVGQNIFTPEDTTRSDLIVDDRPYAGYLYFGVGLRSRKGGRRDVWDINVGVVGPLSLAQEAQDFVHDLIRSPRAQGWQHQLNNEPAFDAICETKWRFGDSQSFNGFGFDFIPHMGFRLGNVAIYANTGFELRAGWYVPNNFGSCTIRPGCDIGTSFNRHGDSSDGSRFGVHVFTGMDGRLVLRDIFLDGNTFHDSHNVEKETLVADMMAGIAFNYRRFRISYAYVIRTPDFKARKDPLVFGAFNLSFAF